VGASRVNRTTARLKQNLGQDHSSGFAGKLPDQRWIGRAPPADGRDATPHQGTEEAGPGHSWSPGSFFSGARKIFSGRDPAGLRAGSRVSVRETGWLGFETGCGRMRTSKLLKVMEEGERDSRFDSRFRDFHWRCIDRLAADRIWSPIGRIPERSTDREEGIFRRMKLLSPFQPARPRRRERSKGVVPRGSLPLLLRPQAFLNQLLHFDHPRLILRNPGIALCRETEFGVFFPGTDTGERRVLSDPVSGLQIDGDEVDRMTYFDEAGAPPAFELHFRSTGNALVVQPRSDAPSCLVTERILRSFRDHEFHGSPVEATTAGEWLDRLTRPAGPEAPRGRQPFARTEAQQAVPGGELRLRVIEPGFRFEGTLLPWRSDRDGAHLRVSDRDGRTAVYLDTREQRIGRAGFCLGHHQQPRL